MQRIALLSLNAAIAALLVVLVNTAQHPTAAQTMAPSGQIGQMGMSAQGAFVGATADLRMQMHQLMSEHTALAAVTTQKAAIGAPDFDAALAHLDLNGVMISQMMGNLYGTDAAAQFLPLWRSHIQMYLDYTLATGRGDLAAKQQIRGALLEWARTQAALFAALNPNASAEAIQAQLVVHVDGTADAIDAFGAGDFQRHYDIAHQGFVHSFMMGDTLAMAIVQQFPDRFSLAR